MQRFMDLQFVLYKSIGKTKSPGYCSGTTYGRGIGGSFSRCSLGLSRELAILKIEGYNRCAPDY